MSENVNPAPKCQRCGAELGPDAPEGLCPRCLLSLNLEAQTEGPAAELGPEGTQVIPSRPEPPPALDELAKLFPQLEIVECLGRGGMGVVYKARQPKLARFVALKIVAREKEKNPQFSDRFQREAQALARLNHPNIVTVYDFGEVGGLYYLLMEYVDGLNLRQLLQSRKLSAHEALAIVPSICEALQYAHSQGVVHRDIKPENILLDKEGRVKIADFGIAKILGAETQAAPLTGAQQVVGTPHYMAPEQVEHPQSVDHRADIYSLGVVFYEMLTGELPLGKFAPPSSKVHIDVRLDEVVLRALEKEPERRYQQANEVKTRVERIASSAEPESSACPGLAGPQAPAGGTSDRARLAEVRRQLAGPAYGLMITSGANVLFLAIAFVISIVGLNMPGRQPAYLPLVIVPILCFGAALIALTLIGAVQMKQLKSYRWSMLAAVLGILSAGLALPFGVWALVVLLRSEVRAAFEGETVSRPAEPRFSRTALVAAGWAPFFLFAFAGLFTVRVVVAPGHPPSPNWMGTLLAFTLLPLGITAPFGTTILGWVAVAQIRRSAGRIYGLGLALFDALVFPLLLLDGVLAFGVSWTIHRFFDPSRLDSFLGFIFILLAVVFVLLLDVVIVRAAWRFAANGGTRPQDRKAKLDWLVGATLGALAAMLLVVAFAAWSGDGPPGFARGRGPRMPTPPRLPGPVGGPERWGGITEHLLPLQDGKTTAMNLQTGSTTSVDSDSDPGAVELSRLREEHMDLLMSGSPLRCRGLDLTIMRLEPDAWQVSASELLRRLSSLADARSSSAEAPIDAGPFTYGFRTRQGAVGLLQVSESSRQPAVIIKRKLVLRPELEAPDASGPPPLRR